MKKQKICIIGGSLTGLTTAISLSKLNCKIDLIIGKSKEKFKSNRTTGISESNFHFLKKLDILKLKSKEVWPCLTMKLYAEDKKKNFSEIFEANTMQKQKNFLYMMQNSKVLKLMIKKIKKIKSISIKNNIQISEIKKSGLFRSVKLKNKSHKYNLIIVCSGSNSSLVKNSFKNKFIATPYGETSITTILNHKALNNHTVRQIFLDNEILAFLPISNTQTSIVWSVKNEEFSKNNLLVKEKIILYAKKFFRQITFATKIEYRSLNFLIRDKYCKDRILLFGDALHVLHPFMGQGFNMILRDLSSLQKILNNKINLGLDIGSADILSEFSSERKPNNFAFSVGVDLLKNSFSIKNKYYKKARNDFLKILNKNNYIKEVFYNIADKGLRF